MATFYSVPGHRKVRTKKKFDLVANQVRILQSKPSGLCCEVIVNEAKHRRYWSSTSGLPLSKRQAAIEAKGKTKRLDDIVLDLNGLNKSDATSTQQVVTPSDTLADELLSYHHKFSHISFDRLREMARQNIIPRRLLKAPTPTCTSCMYATATRRAWRGKPQKGWK